MNTKNKKDNLKAAEQICSIKTERMEINYSEGAYG